MTGRRRAASRALVAGSSLAVLLGASSAGALTSTGAPGGPALIGSADAAAAVADAMETKLAPLRSAGAADALRQLAAMQGETVRLAPAPSEPLPAWTESVPAAYRAPVRQLWTAVQAAELDRAAALVRTTPADVTLARSAYKVSRAIASRTDTAADRAAHARLLDLVERVDTARLAAGAMRLIEAATSWQQSARLPSIPSKCARGDVVFESASCALVVGGPGQTVYDAEVAVVIDQGGNDIYRSSVGTGNRSVSLVLDRGAGNDLYATANGVAVQGSAILGVGVLIDEGGNDVYRYSDSGKTSALAQGAAVLGAGVLWDRGGNDRYTSRNFSQGIAIQGYGLLLDEAGRDSYTVTTAFDSEGYQGSGCLSGAGALVDQGIGDDRYDAAIVDGQGMACYGALGVLRDGGGSDTYLLRSGPGLLGKTEVVQSGWGQGYGELGAVGILLDEGPGADNYVSEARHGGTYEGVHAQGVGLLGTGLLLDGGGDDRYAASFRSQGAGSSAGLGMLRDEAGNDTYRAQQMSQGFGTSIGAVGVLLDVAGNDRYMGGAWVQGAADKLGEGILTDLDGKDSYTARGKCLGFAGQGVALFADLGSQVDSYRCAPGHARNDETWTAGQTGVGVDR